MKAVQRKAGGVPKFGAPCAHQLPRDRVQGVGGVSEGQAGFGVGGHQHAVLVPVEGGGRRAVRLCAPQHGLAADGGRGGNMGDGLGGGHCGRVSCQGWLGTARHSSHQGGTGCLKGMGWPCRHPSPGWLSPCDGGDKDELSQRDKKRVLGQQSHARDGQGGGLGGSRTLDDEVHL